MRKKALLTAEIDMDLLPGIEKLCDVTIDGWARGFTLMDEDELTTKLSGHHILITSYDDVTKKVIEENPQLELIICTRSNPVNIDHLTATKKSIPVVYTPGRNSDCTAEYTIALMFSIARKIPMVYQDLKNRKFLAAEAEEHETKEGLREDVTWALDGNSPYVLYKGVQLKGKTLGIIGFGDIGRKVSTIAAAMGMNILVFDPYISEIVIDSNTHRKVDLDRLLAESDFISLHSKVTEKTRHLINKESLDKMKNTAFLINTSRGAMVDEEALIDALRDKRIAGAALDVYEKEPISEDHPFVGELNNVVISPHLGGATYEALTNHTKMVIEDLANFIHGEEMINLYSAK